MLRGFVELGRPEAPPRADASSWLREFRRAHDFSEEMELEQAERAARPSSPWRPWRGRAPRSVATAVMQFAVTGTLAVVLLGVAAVALLRHTGTSEAIRDAKQVAALAGDGVVAPAITPGLERGDPKAIAAMDRLVHRSVLRDPVVRVKIWNSRGRIVYSDDHRLIGTTYHLGADELESLERRATDAEVSDLSRPENRFERSYDKLLEVYLGVRARDGTPLLYESYQRFASISASGQRLWRRFLPALIGALVLLELAQIPLAWSLAHRLQKGQREREELLRRAIEASEVERRRIASDLHDGVVQNMAGVSYNLAAAAKDLPPGSATRDAVEEGAAQARRTVRELRTLLVDIYPPTLQRSGLEAALSDLVSGISSDGLDARLSVRPGLALPPDAEALLFRAAQEAVRNACTHADASTLTIEVERVNGSVRLEVADDGRGFDPEAAARHNGGHFGLRVLADLARDAGGQFVVRSAQGEGTRVRLEVPVA
jgi:two-component system NarL family sensor kinase